MRIISIYENLEDIRKKISEFYSRPVFICSRLKQSSGTHFRYPGSQEFIKAKSIGRLNLFLSQLDSKSVRREDIYAEEIEYGLDYLKSIWPEYEPEKDDFILDENYRKIVRSDFYYDLFLANYLYLAMPILPEDCLSFKEKLGVCWRYMIFKNFGLSSDLDIIFPFKDEFISDKLSCYVHKRNFAGKTLEKRDGIEFIVSEQIMIPNQIYDQWQLTSSYKNELNVLLPPGQYNLPLLGSYQLNEVYKFSIIDCEPGPCTVCHGIKNERKHFAAIKEYSQLYPVGHLCKICAKDAFKQWEKLLDDDNT